MSHFNGSVDFCVNHDDMWASFMFIVGRFAITIAIDGEAHGYKPLIGTDSSYQDEFKGGECRGMPCIVIDDNEMTEKETVEKLLRPIPPTRYAQLACFSTKHLVPFTPENLFRAHQWCEAHQDFLR